VDAVNENTVLQPRLLIVDDDPHSLRLLNAILQGVAKVYFATSGEEALRQVARHAPDLILLDVDMPGLGGHATCAALKADPETAELPVIFVTSRADTASETQALALGAVDFIHKPVNPPVVLARVKTHLALKQKSDQLRRLIMMDALTGIANRRAFDDSLGREWQRALRRGEPLSLIMIDIDYFKRYNDAYGHPAGDACLRQVADAIAGAAKRAGDVAARYGGEEFAVILPHTSVQDAGMIAERICASVRALAIAHADSPVAKHVTISVGVASVSGSDCTECAPGCAHCSNRVLIEHATHDALIALADQALYAAKRSGRAQIATRSGAVAPHPTFDG
jgi:diguanylate cyclase (GGDEF)-like protein